MPPSHRRRNLAQLSIARHETPNRPRSVLPGALSQQPSRLLVHRHGARSRRRPQRPGTRNARPPGGLGHHSDGAITAQPNYETLPETRDKRMGLATKERSWRDRTRKIDQVCGSRGVDGENHCPCDHKADRTTPRRASDSGERLSIRSPICF